MKKVLSLFITLFIILATTTIAILYSDGWRINKNALLENEENESVVLKTGMLAVRSIPDAAQILLDGKQITATDNTISSLKPGKYQLQVKKDGFELWQKEVQIYPELVTDITAILVLQSPKLEPLTNSDVRAFGLSSNQNQIAYLTKNHKTPGIWVLPLQGSTLNLFKTDTKLLISDNLYATPSLGEEILWSPDDKEILVKLNDSGYLLYETPTGIDKPIQPEALTSKQDVMDRWLKTWKENFLVNKIKDIEKLSPANDIIEMAHNTTYGNWSPDNDKFFYIKGAEGSYQLYVYNTDNPLPIDENRLTNPLAITDKDLTHIYWYSDSYHLIIVEGKEDSDLYTIHLLRIDGSNNIPIYTGTLKSPQAYPTPGGNQIIVTTTLKEEAPQNLYGITLR